MTTCKRFNVYYFKLSLFNFCLLQPGDASSHKKVYLKDLPMIKVSTGTDIQVSHSQVALTLKKDLQIPKCSISLLWLCVGLGLCCRVLQPRQVFPSCQKFWGDGSYENHQHRASESLQLLTSNDICALCWRGLRCSVLQWPGKQRPSQAIWQDTQVNSIPNYFPLIFFYM